MNGNIDKVKSPMFSKEEIIKDYQIAFESRLMSLTGRKEVLTGKAKFGIFGDGKELPQIAMARAFQNGDFRSGYYRDQTFMMAAGLLTPREFFAQLYAHTDVQAEPASAGRMMNGHFGTRLLDEKGNWKSQIDTKNSSSDISPTAGQMPRLLGLALASKYYREQAQSLGNQIFSNNGNEVAWGTIGNASTSEGHFFETINAAGVMQVPMIISVWDDMYGISVPARYQTTKENISEILKGFQRNQTDKGFEIFTVNGWDYASLIEVYTKAAHISRTEHVPCLIHVRELTQPQGHSTSGSHERYKSKERLQWEQDFDGIKKFKEWIITEGIASANEIEALENDAKIKVNTARKAAWENYLNPIIEERNKALALLHQLSNDTNLPQVLESINKLESNNEPMRRDIDGCIAQVLECTIGHSSLARAALLAFKNEYKEQNFDRYSSYMYSESLNAAQNIAFISPQFSDQSKMVDGREIMVACFDAALSRYPEMFAYGEDVGKIGDVNQGFAGLQEKYGESRVFDTGIRELTIIGQGLGAALRGLRPIAEIQYLDYLLYGLQPLSDDVATLQYRTKGGQKAPLIVRTRGHRLEGIWHSGSPMGMIIHSLRGMYVCVPRNMTQAAAMYNTILQSDQPALVIECLNGYRLKEKMPDNIGEITIKLGESECIQEGNDITLVSYGSSIRIAEEAAKRLAALNISLEIIDTRTLIPFDTNFGILESIKKTHKLVILDEDVPGGASSYILQQVLEKQEAFRYLDAQPITITAQEHRPAYGSDGDYYSKPQADHVVERLYKMMHEYNPNVFKSWD